jgi:hypothetical protein
LRGSTYADAIADFVRPLQVALSCVTPQVLTQSGRARVDSPRALALSHGRSALLPGIGRLALKVTYRYRVDDCRGTWNVETLGYEYALLDREGREIVAYHWHPMTGPSTMKAPHLHLGPAAVVGHKMLARAHLPTGVVALQDILVLAISELGVKPRRRDWARILRANWQ